MSCKVCGHSEDYHYCSILRDNDEIKTNGLEVSGCLECEDTVNFYECCEGFV